MKEMLYMGDIGKADDLDSLIKHSQFPSDALFLVELLPQEAVVKPAERQNLLRFAHFDPEIAFAQYTSGRIFHETFELRWEQTDNGKIRVVYLGTTEGDLPGLHPVEGDLARNEQPEYYYLFGIRVKEDDLKKHKFPVPEGESIFTEGRIPRLLRYPISLSEKRRVRLGVYRYVAMNLFRFQSLEATE